MMPSYVQWPDSSALIRRLEAIKREAGPNSRSTNRLKGDIRNLVIEDNKEKLLGRGLLEGVDRYGRTLARMADSTFQNPRRGFGPVLVPRGLGSRFITNLQVTWEGGLLVMRWVGMAWAAYHLLGCPRGSSRRRPNWSLPRRDVSGITPAGFAKIRARHERYAREVLSGR